VSTTIRLRKDRLLETAKIHGWTKLDGEIINARRMADDINLSHSSVTHIMRDLLPVSWGFVGRILAATGCKFNQLFEIVDEDDDAQVAS
jgi:hypothetical protein